MKGYVYITSKGCDPQKGKSLKDPYLGDQPTLGACMPNLRRQVIPGDHIFVVSGRMPEIPQYVIGGFEVADKITALTAHKLYPKHRLHKQEDGQLAGNIIVNSRGKQHYLDTHGNFGRALRITSLGGTRSYSPARMKLSGLGKKRYASCGSCLVSVATHQLTLWVGRAD